ncbi:uncharacterized protein LOC127845958 [Dreissena polymorpha]|uniref:Voltage-gated hydrogen channel 1 n=1 Tax=Dreissena polymorpha TaxID=45954 RepID=A0A9D4N7J2_DREPO|nr:uncharacterized protein LOC127845958 [Dreissena polymorpha]XP_052233106.1 uncharacterized protein LOC127845958 [Dreissena polymorpha]KAH3888162.1 hypothetical protein DPMN_012190 [Dreissena polymorpha]
MILHAVRARLMIKRPTVASSQTGRWRKRRSSAVRTLVAETLVLAKTHGYVEKIEDELERELQRDIRDPPEEKFHRWRRKGDAIFKSKHVLLAVVIMCIADCALVLGELALDLYKVKATLDDSDKLTNETERFLSEIVMYHPILSNRSVSDIYSMLLDARIIWPIRTNNSTEDDDLTDIPIDFVCPDEHSSINVSNIWIREQLVRKINNSSFVAENVDSFPHLKTNLELIGNIAKIFHYCSITLLTIILIETICKAICAGRSFFHRKIEVFDASVVLISFLLDFSFLMFLPNIDTKDFVFILAILLPWRVIRVVDSLIVSVKDHEHFRLKLVYKRKKKIQGNLRDTEVMLQKYMTQVTALQRLCIEEGIDEWKVDMYLKNEELSLPTTPAKRKLKFKFDDSICNMQNHNRGPRCSLPVLDFHGLKLPSRPRFTLPGVAQTIKHHISKNLPGTRRASLAAMELHATSYSSGDLCRRKFASDDLCTMHEEESENEDSPELSRATSESGDVVSRVSVYDSITSDGIFGHSVSKNRIDAGSSESTDEESDTMAKFKEKAKRRNSESTIDKNKVSVNFNEFKNVKNFKTHDAKTLTSPQTSVNGYSVSDLKSKCDRQNVIDTMVCETIVSIVNETDTHCSTELMPLSSFSNDIAENNNKHKEQNNACKRENGQCNGKTKPIKDNDKVDL